MKPLYKIIIVAAVILVGIVGVYFAWKKISAPGIPAGPETGQLPLGGEAGREPADGGETPTPTGEIITSAPKKISERPVFDLWRAGNSNDVFYLTPTGEVMSAKEGPDLEVSKQTFAALNFIFPSPKNEKILLAFGDPISPQWGIFDNSDKVWRPLPSEIQLATWAATSEKLFVLMKTGAEINLAELDLRNTPPSEKILIKDFRLKDIELYSVNGEEIFVHERPSAFYPSRIWKINSKTFAINQLLAPITGLWLRWLPNSAGLVFSSPQNFRIIDKNLQEIFPVVFSTFPSKCAVGEATSTLYCFVPQDLPENLAFPEDYIMKRLYTVDDLYRVDLTEENFAKVWESNTGNVPAIDVKSAVYANNAIYFVNRYDNSLYELKLAK